MVYNHKNTAPKRTVRRPVPKRTRRSSIKLRHVFTLFGILTASSVLLFVLVLVYSSITQYRGFAAGKISIFGTKKLKDSEVLEQADVKQGDNIFKINLDLVRQKLVAHPWINTAEVTREIPGTITIRIREHEPQAIVELNKRYLMNTEGDVFKHFSGKTDLPPTEKDEQDSMDSGYHRGYPVISGFFPEDIKVAGSHVMKNETNAHKAVMNIIQIARMSDSCIPLSHIKQILVDREIGLTLLTSSSIRTIKLGYGNYNEKVRRLEEVSRFLKEKARLEEIDTIDLNNPERIVVKPVQGLKTA